MTGLGSYVVLKVGRGTLVDHHAPMDAGAKSGWFVLRTGKGYALLFADAVEKLAKELLKEHRDKRGVLVADVVAFYRPKMKKLGFKVSHDEWPKKKTEELDGLKKDARLVIGAVATSPSEVFVQLLFITR